MIGFIPPLDRAGIGSQNVTAPASAGKAAGSFADLITGSVSDAVGSLQQAENLSAQALQGRAETREVVDAVMSAEQALQASIAIRDKIVSSYLEISRIQI